MNAHNVAKGEKPNGCTLCGKGREAIWMYTVWQRETSHTNTLDIELVTAKDQIRSTFGVYK